MDQGTNAVDILKGNVYPLKLGFIGIVNRSQQDISENKSLDDSLYSEEQFLPITLLIEQWPINVEPNTLLKH